MTIQRLLLNNFRNLHSAELHPSAGLNIICGKNASGKTSLLEAIHLLSLARSFRSKRLAQLIEHDQLAFTVFAQLLDCQGYSLSLAIQRQASKDETEIQLNGRRPSHLVELTSQLPLQLINPDAFRLLEGSPKERRQFLDWGVFHVEPGFIHVWQRFRRALKQRNSLLRHGRIDPLQLSLWEQELAVTGEQVTRFRQAYLKQLEPVFYQLLAQLSSVVDLKLNFLRGWDKNLTLQASLENAQKKDKEQGFTQVGPQRADLRINLAGRNACEVLSRGQQKLVVSALKLAQGQLLAEATQKRCVYLIDDLPAELDKQHREVFCQVLENQSSQVFITSVEASALDIAWQYPEKHLWFHVEQGQISPQT